MNTPGNHAGSSSFGDPVLSKVLSLVCIAILVSLLAGRIHFGFGLVVGLVSALTLAVIAARRVHRVRSVVAALSGGRSAHLDGTLRGLAAAIEEAHEQSDSLLDELGRERDDFQGILRGTNNGILVLDEQMRVERINESAHRLLASPPQALGRRLDELARNLDLFELAEQARLGEEPPPRQIELFGSGGPRVLHATATRIAGTGGAQRILLALHNVTDLRRLERVRTDFVANVTHEMRSPLASILGYAEMISSEPDDLPENATESIRRIARNARRLDSIINDLVELSRLEHAIAPEVSTIDLEDYLRKVLEGFEDAASDKDLALELEVEALGRPVELDVGLLGQALSNLLDNAIKYSLEDGAVRVLARRLGAQLEIAIQDQGPGIPLEHQTRIFERFYRVDAARSRAVGGTGLGLAIAKHAAAVHGGQLRVENNATRGSTFTLSLPIEAQPGGIRP